MGGGIAGLRLLRDVVKRTGTARYGVPVMRETESEVDPILGRLLKATLTRQTVVGVTLPSSGSRVEFSVPHESREPWQSMLAELYATIDALSESDDEVAKAAIELMRLSGWVIAPHGLVSPPWLRPGVELSYEEVYAHGFDWVAP